METQTITPSPVKVNGGVPPNMTAAFDKTKAEIDARKAKEAELQAIIDSLRAENEGLKKGSTPGTISLKVSDKGAVSVYGLGKFPVTLYQEQMSRLLDAGDAIRSFMKANASALSVKAKK